MGDGGELGGVVLVGEALGAGDLVERGSVPVYRVDDTETVINMTAEPPPPPGRRGPPPIPGPHATKTSGSHVVPRVHPSLQQALADVDIEDEFDIPTFLRRHNSPPAG